MNDVELRHHGIKGQHWGIRRFQNADGTLTAAGKKRASKLEAKYEKLTGKPIQSAAKSDGSSKKKDERSTEDIKSETARLTAINDNIRAKQTYASLTKTKEREISKGKEMAGKFIEKMVDKAGDSLSKAAGKAIDKYLDKALETPADKKAKEKKKASEDLEYETSILEKQARQSNARETLAKNAKAAADRAYENSDEAVNKRREADETTHWVNMQKQSNAKRTIEANEKMIRDMREEEYRKRKERIDAAVNVMNQIPVAQLPPPRGD